MVVSPQPVQGVDPRILQYMEDHQQHILQWNYGLKQKEEMLKVVLYIQYRKNAINHLTMEPNLKRE